MHAPRPKKSFQADQIPFRLHAKTDVQHIAKIGYSIIGPLVPALLKMGARIFEQTGKQNG